MSYKSNFRWIIFIVMTIGFFISSSLALISFQTISERIGTTTKYVVTMKSNIVHERLINQNNQLLYLSKIGESFGIKNVKQFNDHSLSDDEDALVGQYWIQYTGLKRTSQIALIEKLDEEKPLESIHHFQVEQLVKKITQEKLHKIDNEQGLSYFDYVEILDKNNIPIPLLLISKAMYKNGYQSTLYGVHVRALDVKKLFYVAPPVGNHNRSFFSFIDFSFDPKDQFYSHQISIDDKVYKIEPDEGSNRVFNIQKYKNEPLQVNSDFHINNANVNVILSILFLANPVKIAFFVLSLGLSFSGLLAFLITRGLKLQFQKNEENNLRKNQIERSNFFDTLAHELRTPLNGILGMANLLLKSNLDPAQYHYSSAIKQSGYLMNLMVDQTLTASRMETYDIKIVNDVFLMNQLLDQLIDGLGPLADVKHLEFNYDLPKSMNGVSFYGDELRIRQVLINLLGNSIKFTHDGYVRLVISEEKNQNDPLTPWIKFEVIDSGVGLSKEERNELFKKFGRLKKDKFISASEGGLGLYISQRIVTLMGGVLEFHSAPESGTNFFFKIPLKIYHDQTKDDFCFSVLTDKHIMILSDQDNEEAIQYRNLLQQQGAHVFMSDKFLQIRKYFLTQKRESVIPELIYIYQNIDEFKGLKYFSDIQNWLNLDLSLRIIYLHTSTDSVARFKVISTGIKHTCLIPIEPQFLILQAEKTILENLKILPKKIKDQSPRLQGSIFENNLNVLVADDNLLNQEIVSIMLQNLGHYVSVVKTGIEVLKALEQDTFDMILMDINMPELNGIEATMEIRKSNKAYQHIPIIAMSANIGEKFTSLCIENGMNGYLAKPIEIETLDRKIMEILLCPQGS